MFAVPDDLRLAADEGMQSIVMETIVVKILNKDLEPSWNLINVRYIFGVVPYC